MSDGQAAAKEERIALMISAEELAAIDDFRFANRFRSRAEVIRHLCRLGIQGAPAGAGAPSGAQAPRPEAGLRWREDPHMNGVEAWSGAKAIGFVVKISGKDLYAWKLTAVGGSRYGPATSGQCGTLSNGKAALRKAWGRWCSDRGLAEASEPREGAETVPADAV